MLKPICSLIFFALLAPLALHAQGDILPPIERGLESGQRAIAVESSDASVRSLVTRAFDAHGAYRTASADRASFTFRIDPVGERAAKLTISSGNPRQVQFTQEVQGRNKVDAILRAADLAVTKTSGLPGIFAGQIAFISERTGHSELYVGNLFFTETRQLTNDKANCTKPALSPDGRTVLYTSYYKNGFPDIYRINLSGGQREPFLSFKGVNTGATYSPDGTRVAVILSGSGNAELYTVSAGAREMKRLTTNKSLEANPSWSPDGRRIVLTSDQLGKPQLFEISAAGGAMKRLPTNISGYCAEPSWNPRHDNLIAFTIAQAGEFEVALFDSKTGESRVLTRGAGDAVEPVWLRDGRHLLYTERTPDYRRLVLLDTETGHRSYLHDRSWGDSATADYVYP